MNLTATAAEDVALSFLLDDLAIPEDDRDFFSVIGTRPVSSEWYVVEVGVAGLPDKWILQVFDTGQCDPCYTFSSPMPAETDDDLNEFPERIAEVVAAERSNNT